MATPVTLAKERRRHPEGSLPSSKDSMRRKRVEFFANRYFDCQKTKGAGFKPPREAAHSFNSRPIFLLRFGSGSRSRELMPDMTAIYGLRRSPSECAAIGIE